jgi:hypothetical protein
MKQTPEGRVKADIKRWLQDRGIWFYMPVQNGMGVTGIPDFICCWGGNFLGIEAKAPGKRANVSANQERQIMEIHQAGGAALVVDDVSQLAVLEQRNA